jgi:uncharacterized protein YabE (DUF348 family)
MRSKKQLLLLIAGLLLLGGSTLGVGLHKTITIDIDGQQSQAGTWAFSVEQALTSSGIALAAADQVSPPRDSSLKNGQVISIKRARAVQILADGRVYHLDTANQIPINWLQDAGIPQQPGDRILANGMQIDAEVPFSGNSIQVQRLKTIKVIIDDQPQTLETYASSLGEALLAGGIQLHLADDLKPAASTPITDSLEAILHTAHPIQIQVISGTLQTISAAGTIGEALVEAGLSLQGLDYSVPGEDEPVPGNRQIRLVRVREEIIVSQVPIPFETEYQPDSELEIDNQTLIKGGVYGLEVQRERVRYEDNQETGRTVEDKYVARPVENQIIGYGTKIVMHTTVASDGTTVTYWRVVQMQARSYNPTSAGGEITASGERLRKGIVAVDRRLIPFYTRLYIPGYGEAIAADTGGKIVGRIIDLGYSDSDYESWYQPVTVYFLWPPPANIVYIFP